jgi:serine/threonine-protein kinase RsbW
VIAGVPPYYESRATLSAELARVEEFLASLRRLNRGLAGRAQKFCAELLLREALTNAVVHGCRQDPSRQVRCVCRLRRRSFTIAVTDDGDGFNWRAALRRPTDDEGTSGRGMEILRTFSSRVRFNNRGNSIVILKRWTERELR